MMNDDEDENDDEEGNGNDDEEEESPTSTTLTSEPKTSLDRTKVPSMKTMSRVGEDRRREEEREGE